jgi:hypothetical protein
MTVASVWRVYRVLTDHEMRPPLTIETFVADFDTSGEALQYARARLGESMLVREVEPTRRLNRPRAAQGRRVRAWPTLPSSPCTRRR